MKNWNRVECLLQFGFMLKYFFDFMMHLKIFIKIINSFFHLLCLMKK